MSETSEFGIRNVGRREFRRRMKRGKQLAAERERSLPPPRTPTPEQLAERSTLEQLIHMVASDVERSTSLKVPWRILGYDEWERETTSDWLMLSILEEAGMLETLGVETESDTDAEDDEPFWVVDIGGFSGPHTASPETEALIALASTAQDFVIDELQAEWPSCPGHPHPANPSLVPGGRAAWVCPGTGAHVAFIGELKT